MSVSVSEESLPSTDAAPPVSLLDPASDWPVSATCGPTKVVAAPPSPLLVIAALAPVPVIG